MQSCVWMEEQNNSIFDLFNDHQILFSKSLSRVCDQKRTFLLSVLIDNKSVSFLIKCPMPVIESSGDDENNLHTPEKGERESEREHETKETKHL